ncbi:MAG TPA: outer membrane beta-barrel protein [Aequorivita sp.]|nr:outer membrane beta-barrel protein [Aequorivita sp.]
MKAFKLLLLALLASFGIQAQELVAGHATLTKLKNGVFEIIKEDGTKTKIDIRPNVEKHVQGKLSVIFNDCEKTRLSVFEMKIITESELIQTVKDYNNCNYTPFQPNEKEVRQAANFQGDQFKLFASIGASLNRISYFNLDDYENLTQGQIGFGLAATPGFTGSLQGNLYFTVELSAAFSGDTDFENSPFNTNFKKNSYRVSLGAEYHFNKNGAFQPLIGVGAGLVRDHYKGNYGIYRLKQTEGSFFWMPKAGILFSLDDKKSLGLIVSYIPEYEDDLTFINYDLEEVPLIIDTHYFNAGLYFYF